MIDMVRHEYFLENAYTDNFSSIIKKITEKGILFEETIFYPRGGGQPDDKGIIVHEGVEYVVKSITKTPEGVYLGINEDISQLKPGDEVIQQIDWDYRYKLMKHHTVLHILSAVVWNKFEAKVTGGTIYHNKARLDFDLNEFSNELAEDLVLEVNRIINEHHDISIEFVDRKTAEQDPELIRTKINLLPPHITELRLVKIGNVDIQADGGLHVNNTKEIGRVDLVKTENKGKGRKRISVAVVED